jgi:hypothetical protein
MSLLDITSTDSPESCEILAIAPATESKDLYVKLPDENKDWKIVLASPIATLNLLLMLSESLSNEYKVTPANQFVSANELVNFLLSSLP